MNNHFLFSILYLGLFQQNLIAQTANDSTDLFLQIGATYFPFDNNGGLALGLKVGKPKGGFGVSLRNDIMPNFDKIPNNTGAFTNAAQTPLALINIQMNTSIEVNYKLPYKPKKCVTFNLGYAWLTDGVGFYGDPASRFRKGNGTPAMCVALQWSPSWFTLEARGNLALKKKGLVGLNQAPFAIALIKEFRPGKN